MLSLEQVIMISMLDPRVIVIVVGLAAARQGPESLGLGIRGVPLWDTPRWASFSCDGRPMDGAMVNDDHCDCADASDEPGTAACASALDRAEAARARFYCGAGAGYVRASVVDDGVCDCCTGADESSPAGPSCADTCDEGESDAARVARFRAGATARAARIGTGADADDVEAQLRPLLEGRCFSLTSGVFVYEFCPFANVTQRDAETGPLIKPGAEPAQARLLGAFAALPRDAFPRRMEFEGGELCGDTPRRASVALACADAADDRLVAEAEPTMCAYTLEFATNLACDGAHAASIAHLLSDARADPFPVAGGWMRLLDDDGRVFYFGVESGDVRRDAPAAWSEASKDEL